ARGRRGGPAARLVAGAGARARRRRRRRPGAGSGAGPERPAPARGRLGARVGGVGMTTWSRMGMIERTIGAFVLLGAFLLVAVLGTLWQVQQQEADATVVNLAGRQRMLSQGVAMAALAELEGTGEGANALRGRIAAFEEGLTVLLEGDAKLGVPA